ncbi:MAG: acyl-CoA thioesterase II [Saprospiraceae bacterium]|nr:acyl-CoA thioesterase II [Saprospiraceae bacterium]
MNSIQELISLLTLEKLDEGLFRGQNYQTPWGRVFGGQVLGQALHAAYATVPSDRIAHSLHGYFILAGDTRKPIIYQVENTRDGGSFTTRRISAIQNGRPIFVMAVSFQRKQEGFDHQNAMPEVEGPEGLLTDIQQAESIKSIMPDVYAKFKARQQNAIEFRPVEALNFDSDQAGKTIRNVWMKTVQEVELDLPMQHQLLAYASDYDLLLSAVYPHRKKVKANELFIASLDHAMYFHRDFDLKDWLLFVIDSPSASNSRGMGYGRIFDTSGRLVSTVIQEGLIRAKRSK